MLIAKTYLMNSSRKEYIYIGSDYPDKIGYYLLKLEYYCLWDLRRNNIHINHTCGNFGYKDVKDKIVN